MERGVGRALQLASGRPLSKPITHADGASRKRLKKQQTTGGGEQENNGFMIDFGFWIFFQISDAMAIRLS
jgi:hypothetical protein